MYFCTWHVNASIFFISNLLALFVTTSFPRFGLSISICWCSQPAIFSHFTGERDFLFNNGPKSTKYFGIVPCTFFSESKAKRFFHVLSFLWSMNMFNRRLIPSHKKRANVFSFEHPTSANGLIDGLGAPVVWILGIPRMERECYFGVSINWNPASCHHKKVGFGSGSSKLKGLLEGRWRAPELAWPYILVNQLPPPKKK